MITFKYKGEKNMSIKELRKQVESFFKEYHELREQYGKLSRDE